MRPDVSLDARGPLASRRASSYHPGVPSVVSQEVAVKQTRSRAVVLALCVLLIVTVLAVVFASGCSSTSDDENGKLVNASGLAVTKEFVVAGFTSVRFDGKVTAAVLYQEDTFGAAVTLEESLIDYLIVEVQGDTLFVGLDPDYTYSGQTLRATVIMPSLRGLEASSKSRVRVYAFASAQPLTVKVSSGSRVGLSAVGAGDVRFEVSGDAGISGDLSAEVLSAVVSGAARIGLVGTVRAATLEASGASNLELGDLIVRDMVVDLSGGSRGTVVVTDRLDADVSGGSLLKYSGSPALGEVTTSGGGRITHTGD